jgi:siderophore synthetase component
VGRRFVKSDAYLQEKGFIILKEIAAIGYRSEYYEKALQNNNTPYTKMLAALWREAQCLSSTKTNVL